MGSQELSTLAANFRTNAQIVHTSFPIKGVSSEQAQTAAAAKAKLSQSNFYMGQSPMRYNTTTKENSNGKVGIDSFNSIFERKKAAHTNHITNFIDQETGGYEKSPTKNEFGKIPEKIEGG